MRNWNRTIKITLGVIVAVIVLWFMVGCGESVHIVKRGVDPQGNATTTEIKYARRMTDISLEGLKITKEGTDAIPGMTFEIIGLHEVDRSADVANNAIGVVGNALSLIPRSATQPAPSTGE